YGGSYFLVSGVGMLLAMPFFLASLYVPFPYAWICILITEFCVFLNTGPANAATANISPPAIRSSAFAINILVIHLLGDAISPPLMGWASAAFRHTDGRDNLNAGFLAVWAALGVAGFIWLTAAKHLAADTAAAPTLLNDQRG